MDNFLIIAITSPDYYPGEIDRINKILADNAADYVHIRKPNLDEKETEEIIKKINSKYHNRLKLHDHFKLIDKFDLGGIHLNSRNPNVYPGANSVSISYHFLEEIEHSERYDYFFISPVFDSISKENYKGSFDLNELSKQIKGKKAIALGGVTPDKFLLLKSLGFKGAALLGYFFPKP